LDVVLAQGPQMEVTLPDNAPLEMENNCEIVGQA
jgi:hypothetical protein